MLLHLFTFFSYQQNQWHSYFHLAWMRIFKGGTQNLNSSCSHGSHPQYARITDYWKPYLIFSDQSSLFSLLEQIYGTSVHKLLSFKNLLNNRFLLLSHFFSSWNEACILDIENKCLYLITHLRLLKSENAH